MVNLLQLTNFLRPTQLKLAIFAIFLVLVFLGTVQAEGFEPGEKSQLYHLIKPFPFWSIMVYLAMPTIIVTVPLSTIGLGALALPIIIIYFYILACAIKSAASLASQKLIKQKNSRNEKGNK